MCIVSVCTTPVCVVLAELIPLLVCPVCRADLAGSDTGLRCTAGHGFDIARQGYVNLASGLGRAALGGDSAAAVAARTEFLTMGHFALLAAELARLAHVYWPGGLVIDAGAGPGYYLTGVLDALAPARGLALDSSAAALRRAARAHPRAVAVGWDLREPWPVRDGVAGLVLNVFAPRNAAEFARVLRPDGALLVVVPGPDHLDPLVDALGLINVDVLKPIRLAATLDPRFVAVSEHRVAGTAMLGRDEIRAVVAMGPNAKHFDDVTLRERIGGLAESTEVTVDIRVRCYRPR